MEANEPCLGRWVHDDASGLEGLVIEVKTGGWRVEEEFINAIRGTEQIKLTDFATGVRYMEFTEAVAKSAASGSPVALSSSE